MLDSLGEDLDQVPGPHSRTVLYLLAAGDTLAHDLEVAFGRPDGAEQALLGDLERRLVVLFLEPEGAGHAATARLDLLDLAAGDRPQHLHGRAGADQRLLMAVAVEHQLPGSALDLQSGAVLLDGILYELLNQHGAVGDGPRPVVVLEEVEIVVTKAEYTARFQAHHFCALSDQRVDGLDVESCVGARLVDHAVGQHGSSAATRYGYDYLVAHVL